MDKKLTKTLNISGKKGDNYMVNAWGKGTALPETDNDKKRRFGVEVVFVGTDGTEDVHYTNFSPDILDWQFLSDVYAAKKDYTSIKVSYTYCHNANLAFFDGLSRSGRSLDRRIHMIKTASSHLLQTPRRRGQSLHTTKTTI